MSRAIPLLPLWALGGLCRVNFTLLWSIVLVCDGVIWMNVALGSGQWRSVGNVQMDSSGCGIPCSHNGIKS
jgi:hypothetical protein